MPENVTKTPEPMNPPHSAKVIQITPEPITQEAVDKFRLATRTTHSSGIPKTFATLYRRGEFDWLRHYGVDFRNLLHTDQEYTFVEPLKVGDQPTVRTHIADLKERKSLTIMTLHSDILVDDKVKVMCTTTFMIRQTLAESKT